MKKTYKMWTVIWTRVAREEFGIPKNDHGIVPLEDNNGIEFNVNKAKIGRPKIRVATVYPIFDGKEEAEAYRAGNPDWETVQITYTI